MSATAAPVKPARRARREAPVAQPAPAGAAPRVRIGAAVALSACHLAALAAVAWYVAAFFPSERVLVWTMAAAAVVAEAVAVLGRRQLAAQMVLAGLSVGLLFAFRVPWSEGHLTWHAWICLAMAGMVLIPSRATWMMWMVPSIGVELFFIGLTGGGGEVHAASRVLVPLALGCLAVNGWFSGLSGARTTVRHRAPWSAPLRWGLVPAALAAAIGVWMGGWVSYAEYRPAPRVMGDEDNAQKPGGQLLPNAGTSSMTINDHDDTVAARVAWEHPPANFSANDTYYLRAVCFDTLYLEGDELKWRTRDGTPQDVPGTIPADALPGYVLRNAGGSDVVFRPDDGGAVELTGMVGDREGNLFRNGFGEMQRVYRVALDGNRPQVRSDPGYLQLPREIGAGWPWDRIESGTVWPRLPPNQAALAVTAALANRCHYSVDLPAPASGPGGALRTFLFGKEVERRGHCQFFATAAAILLRRAQIPCRLVVGFASHESDPQGVVFRARDAHAWIEIPGVDGRWMRWDPTPPSPRPPDDDQTPLEAPPPMVIPKIQQQIDADEHPVITAVATTMDGWWWAVGAACAALAALVVAVRWRRRGDPRRALLVRRADDLADLARSLGIAVSPATTVSALAQALGERTGVDLRAHLAAHLAARYGSGAVPPPWPVAELRAAARRS
jgi:transglutaminase-like putative cysteine protease